MNPIFRAALIIAAVITGASTAATRAQDASVDQLIKKLPPPEKVAKSTMQPADPALRDPLAKQVADSAKAMNFGNALALSQKLAARYPKSAAAQSLHGQLALALRRFPEASSAFHKALSIQPNSAFAYVGLALIEASQNHLSAAMTDFRQVTRLAPSADIGWIGMSACAEKLGNKGQSLEYARQATTVAPSSFTAWLQLSREEGISGNKQAASKALARANQLRPPAGKSNPR
jgi:tetratricopeptide (TPR) repeat protein